MCNSNPMNLTRLNKDVSANLKYERSCIALNIRPPCAPNQKKGSQRTIINIIKACQLVARS